MNLKTKKEILKGQLVISDPVYLKQNFTFDDDCAGEVQKVVAQIFERVFSGKSEEELDEMKLSIKIEGLDMTSQGPYLMASLEIEKRDKPDQIQRHGSVSPHSAIVFYDTKDTFELLPDEERFIDFLFAVENFFHCGDHNEMFDAVLSGSRFVHGTQWHGDRYQRQFNESYTLFDDPKLFKI